MGGWVSEWVEKQEFPSVYSQLRPTRIDYILSCCFFIGAAAGHKPDIISISSVLGALNRAREEDHGNLKENNAARLDSEIDAVFENCPRSAARRLRAALPRHDVRD